MDDVAVIGIGLRFPGNATNPENLWDVLTKGESQWGEIPRERLNIDGYYHPSGDRLGSVSDFVGSNRLKSANGVEDPVSGRSSSQGRYRSV